MENALENFPRLLEEINNVRLMSETIKEQNKELKRLTRARKTDKDLLHSMANQMKKVEEQLERLTAACEAALAQYQQGLLEFEE